MSNIDVNKLSDDDIDKILDLIEKMSGNPALTDADRHLLGDFADEVGDHATDLTNAALNKDNAAIKALLKKFGDRADDLKKAHDRLVAAAKTMGTFAQGITAFGKLMTTLTAKPK